MKLDFKKEYKKLYSAKKEVELIVVPGFNYLMADGKGDPNTTPLFHSLLEALYSVAYTIKFSIKGQEGVTDYVVPPLEGFWWMGNNEGFDVNKKDEWEWTLMIPQPSFVTPGHLADAKEAVKKKKSIDLNHVRFTQYAEGLSVQILHIGPYSEEHENIKKLHNYMQDNGYTFNGYHHEIYIGDPRKTAPEKLKTILRQPVKKI